MIDDQTISEIIAQYEKHGWKLRRALSSGDEIKLPAGMDVRESDFNALWFSRQSNPDTEAWELRRLTALPFALVTGVAIDASDDELDAALTEIEDEMRERTIA